MKIFTVHSSYAQRGGEDQVFEAERDLLRRYGHSVVEYVQDNKSIGGSAPLNTGLRAIWSQGDFRRVRQRLKEERPDVVAVHNFFPLISPSIYYAAAAEGVPVVQTLHNYRLICPAATMLRQGELCSLCVGRSLPLPAVRYSCYRHSKVLTAGVAAMSSTHRLLGTWNRMVARYIALTEFVRDRYIEGGFDPDKIVVKPNFTEDWRPGDGAANTFVFVGRLSPEKGVDVLLKAWAAAESPYELRIIGSGPEELSLKAQAQTLKNVTFLGHQAPTRVREEMGRALAVIVPSVWYEGFGLTIIEAFSKGTPVLATDIGGMSSLITPGHSGYLFPRADVSALARLIRLGADLRQLREGARGEYVARFTPERNYEYLMGILGSVVRDNQHTR